MSALLIGPDERAAIAEALAVARSRPIPMAVLAAKHIELEDGGALTLDMRLPEHRNRPPSTGVALPFGFAAAISFEEQPPGLCKHLSVGVDKPGALPNRESFWAIAAEFGIDEVAVASYWIEEYKPGYFAVNVVALDVAKGGRA